MQFILGIGLLTYSFYEEFSYSDYKIKYFGDWSVTECIFWISKKELITAKVLKCSKQKLKSF